MLSARKGRLVEKIGTLMRATQRLVQKTAETRALGHTGISLRLNQGPGESICLRINLPPRPQPLPTVRFGQVSPDGTVTQFSKSFFFVCEWMFSLGKTGSAGLCCGFWGTRWGINEALGRQREVSGRGACSLPRSLPTAVPWAPVQEVPRPLKSGYGCAVPEHLYPRSVICEQAK